MSVLDDRVAWHQASVTQTLLVGGRREEEAQLSPSCPEGLGKEVPPPPPQPSPGLAETICVEEAENFELASQSSESALASESHLFPFSKVCKGPQKKGSRNQGSSPPFPLTACVFPGKALTLSGFQCPSRLKWPNEESWS